MGERSLPANEVGYRIPCRGSNKFRKAKIRKNMTLWCVVFEEGAGGKEGEGQEVARRQVISCTLDMLWKGS